MLQISNGQEDPLDVSCPGHTFPQWCSLSTYYVGTRDTPGSESRLISCPHVAHSPVGETHLNEIMTWMNVPSKKRHQLSPLARTVGKMSLCFSPDSGPTDPFPEPRLGATAGDWLAPTPYRPHKPSSEHRWGTQMLLNIVCRIPLK